MRGVEFFLAVSLMTGVASAQSAGQTSPEKPLPGDAGKAQTDARATPTLPRQAWQERRAEFWKTIKGVNAHDADASKDFDAILTQFEKQPFARTPMENMDLLGAFYAQRDPAEGVFTMVSANAALGWYDALRYGSESGRSEIVANEKFFARAFLLSGAATTAKFNEFRKDHPDLVRKAVLQGLMFAEREKNNPHYDVHWPTAYGLEGVICAQGGACNSPKEMPTAEWDKAWEDVKLRVTTYYAGDASTPATK